MTVRLLYQTLHFYSYQLQADVTRSTKDNLARELAIDPYTCNYKTAIFVRGKYLQS